jgi:hypothetical protein
VRFILEVACPVPRIEVGLNEIKCDGSLKATYRPVLASAHCCKKLLIRIIILKQDILSLG